MTLSNSSLRRGARPLAVPLIVALVGVGRAFAQSAANAVAIKRSVDADRLRSAIAASDAERARWSRELHDQTLQTLGALRVLLASNVGRGDGTAKDAAMEHIDVEEKHTEPQMIAAVKQMEAGRKAEDVAREVGCARTPSMHGRRSSVGS